MNYFFFLMMAVITLSSCSEDDDNVSEYANWKERNEQAFADTLAYARKMGEANGWYVYKNWTFEKQTPNKDQNGNLVTLTYKDCDNIIVHVLKKGEGKTSPIVAVSFLLIIIRKVTSSTRVLRVLLMQLQLILPVVWPVDLSMALPPHCSRCIRATIGRCSFHTSWLMARVVILQSKAIQCSVLRWCSRVIRELLARSGLLNNKNKDLEKSMCICLK